MQTVLALIVQAHESAQPETLAATFGVDWPHLGAQIISFAIVCALLYRLAYKPVLAMLATRREQIAQGLANTEKINAKLAAIDADREQVLAEAREQGNKLIADARETAKRLQERETQRAVAAAQEHARMMNELRGEVGRLVVQTTAAVTGKILTTDDQRRLAEETARHL